MSWRILNVQGIAGLAVAAGLALLLVLAKVDARHWKKQAGQYDQLYRAEQAAFATTVADLRAAAEQARHADEANLVRVNAQQSAITERTANDFEARIVAARAYAGGLRKNSASAAAPGPGRVTSLPPVPATARSSVESPREDGLSGSLKSADALTATEQAIQLDELIKWVRSQGSVDFNTAR
jgi:hypothetical protein